VEGPFDAAPVHGAHGREERRHMDFNQNSTALLYAVLALITAGFGVGMLVWQTGATRRAMATRRGMLVGGVLLALLGGAVLLTQIWAIVNNSYGVIR
jgi:hypothetical protein